MKILFVENRYKTLLWEKIAKHYQELGHEIHWIVQNPQFMPQFGAVNILPFPEKNKIEKTYNPSIQKIISADRGIRYFGIQSDDFIFWYNQMIERQIDSIQPDLVFGESTLFHELLTIEICRKKDILFLHPSTCRYPTNRFSFYLYDTLTPYGESGDFFSDEEAKEIIDSIVKRKKLPDYMQKIPVKTVSKAKKIKDKLKLSIGFLLGERYNTPAPWRKMAINKKFQKNIEEWEALAQDTQVLNKGFYLLYAMQMQPEANIDVWGNPFNDQADMVEWIAKQLQGEDKLVVKPNPKSKYEISQKLLAVKKNYPDKIILLKHNSKMDDVWKHISFFITVTGTISIECVFDNKPVGMFGLGIQGDQKNCIRLRLTDDLNQYIQQIKNDTFPKLTEEEKIAFLNLLTNKSFPGINGDGMYGKHYLDDVDNFNLLLNAYTHILNERRSSI